MRNPLAFRFGGRRNTPSDINLVVEVSTTQGVAPLGVVVSAYGTTKTGETKPWRNLVYLFDFGETKAAYANGADPSGTPAKIVGGPCAGYCYETPGNFTLKVHAYDGVTLVSSTPVTIDVQNPDTIFSGTNTLACSTSNNFAGKPAGALDQPVADFAAALALLASGKRVLLCRSDTWTPAVASTLNGTITNAVFGSYGTGTRATVSCPTTAVNGIFRLYNSGISNLILRDIDVSGVAGTRFCTGGSGTTEVVGLTLYNINGHDFSGLISFATGGGAGISNACVTRLNVVKCNADTIIGGSGCNGMYVAIWRWGLFLDNHVVDTTAGEHGLRIAGADQDTFIHGNTFANSGSVALGGKVPLTVRSLGWDSTSSFYYNHTGYGRTTKNCWVSNNRLYTGTVANAAYAMHFAPQAQTSTDRLTNCGAEGNLLMAAGTAAQTQMTITGFGQTLRNNVYYPTTGNADASASTGNIDNSTYTSDDVVESGATVYVAYSPATAYLNGGAVGYSVNWGVYNIGGYAPTAGTRVNAQVSIWQEIVNGAWVLSDPLFAGGFSGLTTSIRAFIPGNTSPWAASATARAENRVDAIGMLRTATPPLGALNLANQNTSIWTLVP